MADENLIDIGSIVYSIQRLPLVRRSVSGLMDEADFGVVTEQLF